MTITLTAPTHNPMVYQDIMAYLNLIYFHRQMDSARERIRWNFQAYRETGDFWFMKQALFWMRQVAISGKAFQEISGMSNGG